MVKALAISGQSSRHKWTPSGNRSWALTGMCINYRVCMSYIVEFKRGFVKVAVSRAGSAYECPLMQRASTAVLKQNTLECNHGNAV